MGKPTNNKIRVANVDDRSVINVELIDRESDSDLLTPLVDDFDDEEMELEDIDLVQLRESSAYFTAGVLPTAVAEGAATDWGRISVPPDRSAMMLYPKPRTRHTVDDLETVISTLPTLERTKPVRRRWSRRSIFSHVAVAGVAILGTWLVMRSAPDAPAQPLKTIVANVSVSPPSPAPAPEVETPKNERPVSSIAPPEPNGTPEVVTTPTAVPTEVGAAPPAPSPPISRDDPPTPAPRPAASAPNVAPTPTPTHETPQPEPPITSEADAVSPRPTTASIAPAVTQKSAPTTVSAASLLPDAEESALPEIPSKSYVRKTMAGLAPEVMRCKGNISGRVVIEVVVSGATGRVISSKAIDQVAVGATAGRCAARAVESATFPQFQREQLTIKYPYDL